MDLQTPPEPRFCVATHELPTILCIIVSLSCSQQHTHLFLLHLIVLIIFGEPGISITPLTTLSRQHFPLQFKHSSVSCHYTYYLKCHIPSFLPKQNHKGLIHIINIRMMTEKSNMKSSNMNSKNSISSQFYTIHKFDLYYTNQIFQLCNISHLYTIFTSQFRYAFWKQESNICLAFLAQSPYIQVFLLMLSLYVRG
jgi:hypothetical protein